MKFKIDKRYIAIQSLLAIVGYMLGVCIVLKCLDLRTPLEFVGSSLVAGITIFFALFYPRNILIKDGRISFVKRNSFERTEVNIADISQVERSYKFYNTLTIITKDGRMYKLYPEDAQELENVINSYK